MAKIRYSLPDPPGCGGTITAIVLACTLVTLNNAVASSSLNFLKQFVPEEILEPRWEQVLLFLMPVIGLILEFWGLFALMQFFWPKRGIGTENDCD